MPGELGEKGPKGDIGERGEKGDRGFTTTINSDGQFPTGIIEGPPGPAGNLIHYLN